MSGSTEPRAALVSIEDQGIIMALVDIQRDAIRFEELNKALVRTQEVLIGVAQYSPPIRKVKMVWKHPQ
jgi:hypothetical protein